MTTEFTDQDLGGARFVRTRLSGAVMRGVDLDGADLDAPWLREGTLLVNGVDVVPYVEAELDRRFPGRSLRGATAPEGLRAAWAAVEGAWADAVDRAEALAGAVDVSVAGEWSFAQTVRHLVMATDTWLGRGIRDVAEPYHPIGQPNTAYGRDGGDPAVFAAGTPAWSEVLAVRADRQAQVRGFLATVTPAELAAERRNPWAPEHPETVLSCLHTILEEEWEHLRFALRDLDVVAGA
jgi:hypothetical protein